jgi:hypothetical protein
MSFCSGWHPEAQKIKLTHEVENASGIDYTLLSDIETELLEKLIGGAIPPALPRRVACEKVNLAPSLVLGAQYRNRSPRVLRGSLQRKERRRNEARHAPGELPAH